MCAFYNIAYRLAAPSLEDTRKELSNSKQTAMLWFCRRDDLGYGDTRAMVTARI